jgi:hypothetical protein
LRNWESRKSSVSCWTDALLTSNRAATFGIDVSPG